MPCTCSRPSPSLTITWKPHCEILQRNTKMVAALLCCYATLVAVFTVVHLAAVLPTLASQFIHPLFILNCVFTLDPLLYYVSPATSAAHIAICAWEQRGWHRLSRAAPMRFQKSCHTTPYLISCVCPFPFLCPTCMSCVLCHPLRHTALPDLTTTSKIIVILCACSFGVCVCACACARVRACSHACARGRALARHLLWAPVHPCKACLISHL